MKDSKCPICDKPGIGDYRNEKIICPTCGSDLSIFVTLSKKEVPKKFLMSTLMGLILILIIIVINAYTTLNKNISQFNYRLTTDSSYIFSLKDSIANIQKRVILQSQQISLNKKVDSSKQFYTIQKGDGFCIISEKLYGTQKYAKDIAKYNALDYQGNIYPGQIIKLPSK